MIFSFRGLVNSSKFRLLMPPLSGPSFQFGGGSFRFLSSLCGFCWSQSAGGALESDLAHWAVMPRALGVAILKASLPEFESLPVHLNLEASEAHARLLRADQLAAEHDRAAAREKRLRPVIRFTSLLLLGLRAIRYHYCKRTCFVASCVHNMIIRSVTQPPPGPLERMTPTSRFLAWCSSPTGVATLRYLRWLAPTSDILQARLQSELGCRPPSATLRLWDTLAQGRGVPLWQLSLLGSQPVVARCLGHAS